MKTDIILPNSRVSGVNFYRSLKQASVWYEGVIYPSTVDMYTDVWVVMEGTGKQED